MKRQSIESRYHEHSGQERAEHGYHKPKSGKKSYKKFKDKELMKSIKDAHKAKSGKKKSGKVEKVMHEFKKGELHSGSKKGPKVKSRKQAVAIALSEARKAGAKIPKRKK